MTHLEDFSFILGADHRVSVPTGASQRLRVKDVVLVQHWGEELLSNLQSKDEFQMESKQSLQTLHIGQGAFDWKTFFYKNVTVCKVFFSTPSDHNFLEYD